MQSPLPLAVLLVCLAVTSTVVSDTRLSYDLIDTELVHLGVDPRASVLSRFPNEKAKLLARAGANRLNGCYKTLPGQKNIFQDPIRSVIYEFLKSHNLDRTSASTQALRQKVQNVNLNIKDLAEYTFKCVANNEPNFVPTTLGLTQFASWSREELANFYKPLRRFVSRKKKKLGREPGSTLSPNDDITENGIQLEPDSNISLPARFDYRDLGVVTPIKDQKGCGFCFVFSSVAALESSFMLKHNHRNVVFSEAELVNCLWADEIYNTLNCKDGGYPPQAMEIAEKHGITLQEHSEPYQPPEHQGDPYPFHPQRCGHVKVDSRAIGYGQYTDAPVENGEAILKSLLLKYGPLVVAYRAAWLGDKLVGDQFNRLIGKVHNDLPCNASVAHNHAMTVVGWDEEHLIIKNSYGSDWGSNGGYLYMPLKLAESCGVIGMGSAWFWPEVE